MKIAMAKTVFTVFLLAIHCLAYSQGSCAIDSNIYFINGVNKPSEKEVRDNAISLKSRVFTFSSNALKIRQVTYLYNDSDGLFLDVFYELAAQKAAERKAIISETLLSFAMAAFGNIKSISEVDQIDVQNLLAKTIGNDLPQKTQDLVTKFSQQVSAESLNKGVQAILVPHSQGNMFANAVYAKLRVDLPKHLFRGLGVVNVANPAATAPSGLYITAYQDMVINYMAKSQSVLGITFLPMAANYDATGALDYDALGHGFEEVYLNPKVPTGAAIANASPAAVVKKIDSALYSTSTFFEPPNYYYDAYGVKQPRLPWMPVDSTLAMVCFPSPVGGI